MSSQKKIEIHQSSFLSLKAELLKKRQEVRDAKLSEFPNKPTVVRKVKTKLDRGNEGVDERNSRDLKEVEEEKNILQKSKRVLEAKSKLYDELSKNPEHAASDNDILVNFSKKQKENEGEEIAADEPEEDFVDDFDDDKEWVDFVDCLGRTKRCHKDDLASMKISDEKLRLSLFGRSEAREAKEDDHGKEVEGVPGQPDLSSDDMRRKMLREKWEEEERQLADRRDIHYQHVLFDEARSHGVGYYHFSTDEAERSQQLKDLENLRKQTLEQQAVAKEALKRRKKQLDERLRAARRRKRERLGLPPEEETEGAEEVEEEPAKPEELKREEQTSSTIRAWDMGKKPSKKIYTQEEWIEMKRAERPKEFAPPQCFESTRPTRKRKPEEKSLPEAYLEDISPGPKNTPFVEGGSSRLERERGAGVEIPPPPTFELYGPSSRKTLPFAVTPDIEKSIEEGLNYIRRQVEEKKVRDEKFPFDPY